MSKKKKDTTARTPKKPTTRKPAEGKKTAQAGKKAKAPAVTAGPATTEAPSAAVESPKKAEEIRAGATQGPQAPEAPAAPGHEAMSQAGPMPNVVHGVSLLTEQDIYLFKEGRHHRLYEKLGAHPMRTDGVEGVLFSVWAPNAQEVYVFGDFNGWDKSTCPLGVRWDGSGIWEGFVPGAHHGQHYKYHIKANNGAFAKDKPDPFAFHTEVPPSMASVVWNLDYEWQDGEWMADRHQNNALNAPMSTYECHLGSWQRKPEEDNRSLNYTETGQSLGNYLRETGFTHVELMPVMEHPFYGSWGYQCTGYYAPSSRFGTPQEFMAMVDKMHELGVGVILDWVPSHFPTDEQGLMYFDGTHLYEHEDPRKGIHKDWNSAIFNYGRHEVRNFLISNALFWLDKYHVDGLRVDAVASMLYLDYSREEGEWEPNIHGGNENLEAIEFIRQFNEAVYKEYPDVQTIAEESTAWPGVSRPLYVGGLGFGLKWNMGWMHDTLDYMKQDPVYRKFHHDRLTFSIMYTFTENFVLSLSHDEVVHGKGSILNKMPGDIWQKHANLRALYGYMWSHPGKKMLFMGSEFGQYREWNHDDSLDWHLLENPEHQGLLRWMRDLNTFYRAAPSLYDQDFNPDGFAWVDFRDTESSIICYLRYSTDRKHMTLVVCNFTPMPRNNYRVGVPKAGFWKEALNSDAHIYGGSGWGNLGGVDSKPVASHGHYDSISLNIPPLSVMYLTPEPEATQEP